jgi:tetratricopeptide (TPR) repeat protein
VEARLDDYAGAWVAARTEACEATSVRKEQSAEAMDLRMACLDRRLVEVRAAVGVLAEADAMRVEKAVTLVEALPTLTRCDDVAALAAERAELPPPEDSELAASVQAQREALAEVRALLEAGDFRRGHAQAETVVEAATSLGYGPLLAEAMLERGTARSRLDRHAESDADLEQAYLLAVEHEHDEVEIDAVTQRLFVLSFGLAHQERAEQWVTIALALAKRSSTSELQRANVSYSAGMVLMKGDRLDEAREHLELALALGESARGSGHPNVTLTLNQLGAVLLRQGKLDEALAQQERALTIQEATLGPGHPQVMHSLIGIGSVLSEQGQGDRALEALQRSLAIAEAALGADSYQASFSRYNIGSTLGRMGRMDEALHQFRLALAIREKTLGPDHPEVAATLCNIGIALQEQGKLDEALAHMERALEIMERALGPRHREVAWVLSNLGRVRLGRGQADVALRDFERSLEIQKQVLGMKHYAVAIDLERIALARRALGDLDGAKAALEQALAVAEESVGPTNRVVGGVLVVLAQVELERGGTEVDLPAEELAAAREHAERAIAILEASKAGPARLAVPRFALARLMWSDPSQRTQARALAEQARDELQGQQGSEETYAEVIAWLERTRGG